MTPSDNFVLRPFSSADNNQQKISHSPVTTYGRLVGTDEVNTFKFTPIDINLLETSKDIESAQTVNNFSKGGIFASMTGGSLAVDKEAYKTLEGRDLKIISSSGETVEISAHSIRAMTKEEESELVDLFNRIMAEGNHMELVANDKEEGTEKKVEKRDLRGKVTDNRDQVNQDNKTYFAQRMILNGIMANLKSMFAKVEKRKSEDKAKRQEEHEKVMDKIVEKAQQHFKEATRTNEKEQNNDKRASEANVAKIRGDITHTTSRPEVIRNDVTPPKS